MLTQELVKEHLDYDPLTGIFLWKKPTNRNVIKGVVAGATDGLGYRTIAILGKRYMAHRLAWIYVHGTLPKQIDHINMVRDDNRIANLRPATNAENNWNRKVQSNNRSGYKGVTYHKQTKKFHAKICANGIKKSLGYYGTAEEAHQAYVKASGELHGQFARFN